LIGQHNLDTEAVPVERRRRNPVFSQQGIRLHI